MAAAAQFPTLDIEGVIAERKPHLCLPPPPSRRAVVAGSDARRLDYYDNALPAGRIMLNSPAKSRSPSRWPTRGRLLAPRSKDATRFCHDVGRGSSGATADQHPPLGQNEASDASTANVGSRRKLRVQGGRPEPPGRVANGHSRTASALSKRLSPKADPRTSAARMRRVGGSWSFRLAHCQPQAQQEQVAMFHIAPMSCRRYYNVHQSSQQLDGIVCLVE